MLGTSFTTVDSVDCGRYKKAAGNVTELIGLTPLIKLHKLIEHAGMSELKLLGKAEFLNPSGSLKDRVVQALALAIIPLAASRPVAAAATMPRESPAPSPATNRFSTFVSMFSSTWICIAYSLTSGA